MWIFEGGEQDRKESGLAGSNQRSCVHKKERLFLSELQFDFDTV